MAVRPPLLFIPETASTAQRGWTRFLPALSFQARLLCGFGFILTLLILVALVAVTRLNASIDSSRRIYEENVLGVQFALETSLHMTASERDERRVYLETDALSRSVLITSARYEMLQAQGDLLDYRRTFASAEDARQWEEVEVLVGRVVPQRERVLALLAEGRDADARLATQEMASASMAMDEALRAAGQFNTALSASTLASVASSGQRARVVLIVSTTLAVVVGSGSALLLSSSVAAGVRRLNEAESLLEQIVETAPDGILLINPQGTIVLVNAQIEKLAGYPRHELIGRNVDFLLAERFRAMLPDHRAALLREKRPGPQIFTDELSGLRKDGLEFPVELSQAVLQLDSGPLIIDVVRDGTERIELLTLRVQQEAQGAQDRLIAELNQTRRLESLGQLAGGVAHDFNNLLSVILSYSSFVSDVLEEEATSSPRPEPLQQARHDLEQITTAAERAARLTRQLLTFARRGPTEIEALDLNAVVNDVQELLARSIGEQVRLSTDLAPGLLLVAADRGQVEQILLNLAVNARDAMPDGGTLSITTENVEIAEQDDQHPALAAGAYARLQVDDTGVGMAPDVLARVFEPFFTTKPSGRGTGLGLATVYGIVRQANGSIHLESEPGAGTRVSILLPASTGAERIDTASTVPSVTSEATVLLVEDEPALRNVTERILTSYGYRVLAAASGEEAIEIANGYAEPIDLLLTDVIMPGMNGRMVADRIRTVRPGVRVLYMSGYAQDVMTQRGILDADIKPMQKPFSVPTLIQSILEALRPS